MKMEETECSETSAYKIQTPGNYPEENMQSTEHGESLKSRSVLLLSGFTINISRHFPFISVFMKFVVCQINLRGA